MKAITRTSLAILVLLAGTGRAGATSVTLDQCTILGLCGQATVTTTLVGSAIDVDVAAGDPVFGIFGDSGANRAFGFNVLDPDAGVVISDLTGGFSYAGDGVNSMGGGMGDFEFMIDGPHTGSAAALPLHFRVSRTGGFTSDLQLYEANALGFYFGAHLRNSDTGVTGFVGVDPPPSSTQDVSPVPEPASLALFGTGLAGLARSLRRRRRKVA